MRDATFRWAIVAGVGFLLLGGLAQQHATIEANALVLRDAEGRDYLSIHSAPEAGASFLMRDEEGRARIRFRISNNGTPTMTMSDARGGDRLEMSLLDEATPRILLRDATGTERAKLLLMPEGSPLLYLKDREGTNRVELASLWNGLNGMVVFDERQRPQCLLATVRGEGPALRFVDGSGVLRLQAGLDERGDPAVDATDEAGRPTWSPLSDGP